MEQKQERGKGKRDVEPWGIRHATAEDAAFSGIPADLMDITLHWFLTYRFSVLQQKRKPDHFKRLERVLT